MAKYKIKVIKHLLKGNKFATSGEVVDESQFIDLQLSIKGGFCELFESDEKNDVVESSKKQADEPTELELEIKKIKKFSKDELKAFCAENDIDYDEKLNKDDLKAFIIDILENQTEEEE